MANILPTTMEYFDKLLGEQLLEGEGGGGGSWQTVFEESVTTQASGDNARAIVQGYDLSADTIKVTFNGTEYVCEFKETTGYGAGDNGSGDLDWSEYPFNIFPRGGALKITTETAGTYTLKIEEPQSGGSSDFSTAEVTIIWSNPDIEEVVWNNCPAILEDLVRGVMYAETSPATIIVPLYQNKCYWDQSTSGLTLSGNIEDVGDGMIITGDCTITIS